MTAPCFTISLVIILALPTAATKMSAFLQCSSKDLVLLWHRVTVASTPFCDNRSDNGVPTIVLRPTITTCLPLGSFPERYNNSIIPAGVQGTIPEIPCTNFPRFSE